MLSLNESGSPTKNMPQRNYMLSVIAAVLMVLLLVSCGKKGPLYHPDSPPKPGHKQPKS